MTYVFILFGIKVNLHNLAQHLNIKLKFIKDFNL